MCFLSAATNLITRHDRNPSSLAVVSLHTVSLVKERVLLPQRSTREQRDLSSMHRRARDCLNVLPPIRRQPRHMPEKWTVQGP